MQDQCYYRCLPVNGETNIIYILRDSGVTETNPKQTSSCFKTLSIEVFGLDQKKILRLLWLVN